MASSSENRPLSPHLQIYRWPLSMALSILHRATGIALSVGALYLVCWLVHVAFPGAGYMDLQSFNGSVIGLILLFGWTVSLFFHLCSGIRHLFWDAGYGYEIEQAHRSGMVVVIATAVLTVIAWIAALAF